MRKLAVFLFNVLLTKQHWMILFAAFVLWSSYHGFYMKHNTYPTQAACEAKAKIAADEWWVYYQVTRDKRWDADSDMERNYQQIHKPLMNGTYSCWPEGRDLYEDPPPARVRPWPTKPGQQP